MKDFLTFINQFVRNKGLLVFLSIIIAKLTLFINMVFVVKMIDEATFGKITLIASVLAFFTPINGFGSVQGLMKFGAAEQQPDLKNNLSRYLFWRGMLYQTVVTVLFVSVCFIYTLKYEHLLLIIGCFAFRLAGFYFLTHIQVDYRIRNDNSRFALLTIAVNTAGLALTILLTYMYKAEGYLTAMAMSPWLVFFFLKKSHWQGAKFPLPDIKLNTLWKYGAWESIAYLTSEILFSLDIAMIALYMSETDIALYKVAILIPMNLLFLPSIFLQADFPKIVAEHRNKKYISFYIRNYLKIFIPAGIVLLLSGYAVKEPVLAYIFKAEYVQGSGVFFIALCGVVCAMWTKVLFVHFISAAGKAVWNTYISIIAIAILIAMAFLLIPEYGIEGAAISMALAFAGSGICAALFYTKYYRSLR